MGPIQVSSVVTTSKLLSRLAVVTVLLVALAPRITAHEVPNEVSVLGFVHPEGKTLRFIVRAPLKSMRDIDVPTVNGDYRRFYELFRDAVRTGSPPPVDPRDAIRGLRVLEAAETSARTGSVVSPAPV